MERWHTAGRAAPFLLLFRKQLSPMWLLRSKNFLVWARLHPDSSLELFSLFLGCDICKFNKEQSFLTLKIREIECLPASCFVSDFQRKHLLCNGDGLVIILVSMKGDLDKNTFQNVIDSVKILSGTTIYLIPQEQFSSLPSGECKNSTDSPSRIEWNNSLVAVTDLGTVKRKFASIESRVNRWCNSFPMISQFIPRQWMSKLRLFLQPLCDC